MRFAMRCEVYNMKSVFCALMGRENGKKITHMPPPFNITILYTRLLCHSHQIVCHTTNSNPQRAERASRVLLMKTVFPSPFACIYCTIYTYIYIYARKRKSISPLVRRRRRLRAVALRVNKLTTPLDLFHMYDTAWCYRDLCCIFFLSRWQGVCCICCVCVYWLCIVCLQHTTSAS